MSTATRAGGAPGPGAAYLFEREAAASLVSRGSLERLLEERGITLTELSERVGITLANLSILKTNKARAVRFTTLAGLCRELECQPGDLLAYEDEG